MKKLLSVVIAVAMMAAMFSGLVLFNASAAAVVRMSVPGIDQYTAAQAARMAKGSGTGHTFTKEGDHVVVTLTTSDAASWGKYPAQFDTATGIDQWTKNPLIDGLSPFGDVDLSNKLSICVKFVTQDGYPNFTGQIFMTFGSSTKKVAIDHKSATVNAEGYHVYDLSKIEVVGAGWYQDCPTLADAYYGVIDQVKFSFQGNSPSTTYSFSIEDWYVTGYTDTTELLRKIVAGKNLGVDADVIAEAEAVYKNTANTDQTLVDDYVDRIAQLIDEQAALYTETKNELNDLLDQADMLGFFDETSIYFDISVEADQVLTNPESTTEQLLEQVNIMRKAIAGETMDAELYELLIKAGNAWEYNYTKASYDALGAVAENIWSTYAEGDQVQMLADITAAYDALVPAVIYQAVDCGIGEWTTESVNDVVDTNSGKLCDSIGDGLNRDGVWNAGDFSNNTVFEVVDEAFEMTVTADFTGKSIGWKNLDRSGTLAAEALGAYPTLNFDGLSDADGIRLKIGVSESGSAERILIGLSNCLTTTREMYALNIRPESVDADGYINIPFSYFQKAWWCSAFAQDELDSVICLIIEAYGVTEGTTLSFSNLTGYTYTKPFVQATQEQIDALNEAVADLEEISLGDDYFDELLGLADDAIESDDGDVITEATAEVISMLDSYIPTGSTSAIDRSAAKAKLIELIGMDTAEYYETEIAAMKASYYDTELTTDGVTAIVDECTTYILKLTPPEAPAAPTLSSVTTDTVTLVAATRSHEFKYDGGEWQTSNIFTDLEPNTEYTFYARIMAKTPTPASEPSRGLAVTTLKLAFSGDASIEGDAKYNSTLTAATENLPENCGELTYEWYRLLNLGAELVGTESSYTLVKEDIGCTFSVKVFAANYEGNIESEATAVVGRATPEIITAPTASEIILGSPLSAATLTGGEAEVDGAWQFKTPAVIPDYEQSGSEFEVIFVPTDGECYDSVTIKVVVNIKVAYEELSFTDEELGVTISGKFFTDTVTGIEYEAILPGDTAYLALLRAAKNSNSENNLLFMYHVNIGDGSAKLYVGELTFAAQMAVKYAGSSYTVWFFADGGIVSAEATVDANGLLTIEGIEF